jgi:acyl-CoA synthetase (AMP-forming)/AMP-acid ligase II
MTRHNVRDPLVPRLLGPGKPYELEDTLVFGRPHKVFKGAPRNLAGLFRQGMAFGSNTMVVHDEVRLTYDEAFAKAASLSRVLRERFGVTIGTRVAMVMGNRAEWIVSLMAITAAGGVAALVNSRGVAEEMLRAIRTAGCTIAIVDAERDAIIAAEVPDPPWPRIVIGAGPHDLRPGDVDFGQATTLYPNEPLAPVETSPEDGALVLFTSGTTGFPKAALLSHGALTHGLSLSGFMGALQDLRYEVEVGEALPAHKRSMVSPVVILGPMFHLGGMMPSLRGLAFGATVFIMTKWNVDIAFDMIEREGVARLAFVPAMLWDMLRSPRAGPQNIGQVLYLSSGAASLNPALVAEIRARMPKCLLANTYGQSETSAWTCSISGQAYFDNPDSCGWAVPSLKVQLRRDDGSLAEIGEPGELWVRSPGLMTEYAGDPEATAATLKDGWLATGDVGIEDEHGLFRIVDRKKNMVISGGENIYCAEVERVLGDYPGVVETMAYGEPDPRLGERVVATVVVDPGGPMDEDALKAHCRQHLAIYKVPRAIRFTTERLPRTASGKHDRGKFLAAVRQKADGGAS